MSEWAPRRFWKEAGVTPAGGGFAVHLDGRPVMTPGRMPLVVPGEALARQIAAEWQAQDARIDPHSMPLTRMANTAIDRLGEARGAVATMLAGFGASDLLCHRAPGPEALARRQAEAWDPLLRWADEALGVALVVTTGVIAPPQPAAGLARLARALEALSVFELAAVHDLVTISGSVILALAVERGRLGAAEAHDLSRLDEDWQAGIWGRDDEAAQAAAARRAAFADAHRFLLLCREGAPAATATPAAAAVPGARP